MHYSIDTYAVIGNPIAHSKSPFIHQQFAQQTKQLIQYLKIEAPLDNFAATLIEFQQRGGKGANITVPFKQQAYEFVTQHSTRAKLAHAVNTIIFDSDSSTIGDNTDGIGLVRDLSINHSFTPAQKNILILGAGGAVQGILEPLLTEQPRQIIIVNRTASKAQQLAQFFKSYGEVIGCGYDQLQLQHFDLIINGTSASLHAELPPLLPQFIKPQTFCYDMVYSVQLTPFLNWAVNLGAQKYSDGKGMLVEQAAESFYLWRGIRPNTEPVLKLLREQR